MKQKSAAGGKAKVPPPLVNDLPLGLSPAQERHARPVLCKALHDLHPKATREELAGLYQAQFGIRLTREMIGIALRRAGVFRGAAKHAEVSVRADRIAEICAAIPRPTKDKIIAEYQRKYGVALNTYAVYELLKQLGIKLNVRRRYPEHDEVALRPMRLMELVKRNPDLNYDELGKKYEEKYDIRLGPSLVGNALHTLDIYKHRRVDPEELAERPQRLRILSEQYPEMTLGDLAHRYSLMYDTKLSENTVGHALTSMGIYRQPLPSPVEAHERQARITALHELHPALSDDELAKEYETRYGTSLEADIIRRTLNLLGIHLPGQRRSRDPEELRERPERLKTLAEQHPGWAFRQLGIEYHRIYGIKLDQNIVRKVLLQYTDICQQRTRKAEEELEQRPMRLKDLYKLHPEMSWGQLAKEYHRIYGIFLKPTTFQHVINSIGIYRLRRPDQEELEARPERLKTLKTQHPEWTYKRLGEEYGNQFSIRLSHTLVSHALASLGIFSQRRRRP